MIQRSEEISSPVQIAILSHAESLRCLNDQGTAIIREVTGGALKEYVWRNGYTTECENALDDFWTLLNQNWVFVEARPDNLSVRQDLDGDCQIFAIDGYAYGQFIPLSKWFKKERIRVLQKRRRKQRVVIDEILKQRESGEILSPQGFQL